MRKVNNQIISYDRRGVDHLACLRVAGRTGNLVFVEGTSVRELLCLPPQTHILLDFSHAVVRQEVALWFVRQRLYPERGRKDRSLDSNPSFSWLSP